MYVCIFINKTKTLWEFIITKFLMTITLNQYLPCSKVHNDFILKIITSALCIYWTVRHNKLCMNDWRLFFVITPNYIVSICTTKLKVQTLGYWPHPACILFSDVMKHTQFPLDSSIVLSMASNGKTAPELDFCLGFYTTETGYILFRLSIDMSMLESLSMFTPKSGSLWPAMFIDYTAYSTN
jgi:hypothetical protein